MKTIITVLLLTFYLNISAQSKINVSAGYKAIELGYQFRNEETLNYGVSLSAVSSSIVEKRANRNDVNKNVHEFNSKVIPAIFGTIGSSWDNGVTITGKLGSVYLDQKINSIQEPQKLYFAVGIMFEYNDFTIGYDNVNAVLVGYSIKL